MENVLLTLAVVLSALIVLLAIPLSLSFSVTRLQAVEGYIQLRWLFGLVNIKTNIPIKTTTKERTKTSHHKKPKRKNNGNDIVALLKQSSFRQHMMKFIKRVLRASNAENLYLKLRIGLGDPADTGLLWAILGPVSGMMKNLQSMQIDIEPDFIDEVMEVNSHGQFHLIPLQLIALVIGFILSPTTLRALRTTQR